MNKVRAFLTVSRLEYLAGGVFFLAAVAALGARSAARLVGQLSWVALGCVLWIFCHLVGSHVNCLADYDLDKHYKTRLPDSIDTLGRTSLVATTVAEGVLATAIATLFCTRTRNLVPLVLFLAGLLLTIGYSLEPIRFKRRGFLNPLSLLLVLYGLPVSFGYLSLTPAIDIRIVVLLMAVGAQMFGVILMNPLADIPEDRDAAVLTPFVRYGLRPVASIALVAYLAGALGEMVALAFLVDVRSAALTLFMFLGLMVGHAWVAVSIAMLFHAKDQGAIRKLGELNSKQFAVVGAAFGTSSLLVLFRS